MLIYSIIFSFLYPYTFPTYGNFAAILINMAIDLVVVIAMSIILISGEIDLSLGSNMALSGVLCGYLIKYLGVSIPLAILITFAIAVLIGLINGVIIAKIGVTSFIATLATSLIYKGIAVRLAGPGISDLPLNFNALGQEMFLKLQLPVWYSLVILIIFSYCMSRTRFFRQYYYIGGNVKAAILSGMNIPKMKIIAFILSSCLACFAGIISAARYGNAMCTVGTGIEMSVITAAVIGGVSFSGGAGTIFGAAVGALFMALLNNALIIANVDAYWQNVVTGIILVLAVIFDIVVSRRKS